MMTKLSSRPLFRTLCGALFFCIVISNGRSQNDAEIEAAEKAAEQKEAEKVREAQQSRWEKILEGIRGDSRDRVIRHLAVVISEIDLSSKLDPAQLQKLEIGAKGAAEKAVEDWILNLERQDGLIQNLEAMAANIPNNDVEKNDKEALANIDQVIAQWGRQLQPEVAENQPVWSATLDKTLTEEQKNSWEETKNQRSEYAKSLQIAQSVQMVDNLLRLTNQQRQRFFELLNGIEPDEKDGDGAANPNPVAIQADGRIIIRQQIRAVNGRVIVVNRNGRGNDNNGAPGIQGLDRAKVAEILTEAQLARWDDMLKQPNPFQGGNAWGNQMQMFQGGVIIID